MGGGGGGGVGRGGGFVVSSQRFCKLKNQYATMASLKSQKKVSTGGLLGRLVAADLPGKIYR